MREDKMLWKKNKNMEADALFFTCRHFVLYDIT